MLPSRIFFDDMLDGFKPVDKMKCDIYEEGDSYNIEVDIPGFNKEDIQIEYDKGVLIVTAEKKEEEETNKKYIRRERTFYGKYQRSFTLNDIDEENIDASFKDGILKITVPKMDQKTTNKLIEIK